jgi:hypothetical protein
MAIRVEHELHRRRLGRNVGLGLVLGAFVALVFGLTIVKVSNGGLAAAAAHMDDAPANAGGGG